MEVDQRGLIRLIRDAPESVMKIDVEALPSLNMAASFLSRYVIPLDIHSNNQVPHHEEMHSRFARYILRELGGFEGHGTDPFLCCLQ